MAGPPSRGYPPGMPTSLLDFVMGLVRDADVAARYAADPAAALAAADLDGVTAADVDNLIPMVTDSLAMSTPDLAGTARADAGDPNVWASGAAAVAFAAFDPVRPTDVPSAGPREPVSQVAPDVAAGQGFPAQGFPGNEAPGQVVPGPAAPAAPPLLGADPVQAGPVQADPVHADAVPADPFDPGADHGWLDAPPADHHPGSPPAGHPGDFWHTP